MKPRGPPCKQEPAVSGLCQITSKWRLLALSRSRGFAFNYTLGTASQPDSAHLTEVKEKKEREGKYTSRGKGVKQNTHHKKCHKRHREARHWPTTVLAVRLKCKLHADTPGSLENQSRPLDLQTHSALPSVKGTSVSPSCWSSPSNLLQTRPPLRRPQNRATLHTDMFRGYGAGRPQVSGLV